MSASLINRLTTAWQDEHRAFMARNLADRDYVYLWADGVHFTCVSRRNGCAVS
jgi:hypothetical protein